MWRSRARRDKMRQKLLPIFLILLLSISVVSASAQGIPVGVYGYVYMPDGSPAAGASVTVSGGGDTAITTTDSSGQYHVVLTVSSIPVTVTVTASKGGYSGTASATGEGTIRVDVRLSAPSPAVVVVPAAAAPFNFTLEISPLSDAAQQGVSKQVKITVNLVSGSPELVSLKATGIPPGASGEFSPSSGYPTFTSILTISTSESTPPGTYAIKIEAEGGGLKREAVYTLNVIPKIPPIQYFMDHLGNLTGKTVVYRKVIEGKTVEVVVDYRTIIKYEKTGYCGLENMPPAYSIDEQIKQWKAGYSKNRMYYGVDGCWYWVYFPATYKE
jgi:hypothetical protein